MRRWSVSHYREKCFDIAPEHAAEFAPSGRFLHRPSRRYTSARVVFQRELGWRRDTSKAVDQGAGVSMAVNSRHRFRTSVSCTNLETPEPAFHRRGGLLFATGRLQTGEAKRRAGAAFQTGDVAEGEINVLANYSKLQ